MEEMRKYKTKVMEDQQSKQKENLDHHAEQQQMLYSGVNKRKCVTEGVGVLMTPEMYSR